MRQVSPCRFLAGLVSAGLMVSVVTAQDEPLLVFTGIPPQAGLLKRIGGSHIRVETLLPAGANPHFFEPLPSHVARLTRAALYFKIGLPFEQRILAKLPHAPAGPKIIEATAGIPLRCVRAHEHEDEHDHEAGGHDPHVWLSARNLRVMARNMTAALAAADPARAAEYEAAGTELDHELEALDAELRTELEPYKGRVFFVYHPAFGYFADDYGLQQEAVEIDGREPSPRQLAALIERARSEGVRILFASPQFSQASAQAVARSVSGAVILLDPLAEDILEGLRTAAREIGQALSRATPCSEAP